MFKKIKLFFDLQSRIKSLETRFSRIEKEIGKLADNLQNLEFTEFVYEPEASEEDFLSWGSEEKETLIN